MNKTISINLGGIPFTIDEDAYQLLRQYLETLKRYFSHSESKDEILQDIEARIAEMFQERLNEAKKVIGKADVEEVIALLGKPEDYLDEEELQEAASSTQAKRKRLFRDPDNRVIGGVCSGISHYIGIDPVWIRLALALSFLTFGFGVVLYILLWIIIPEAKTVSEKLEMKGEPVNFDSIGKTVEEEFENVREHFKANRGQGKRAASQLSAFFDDLLQFVIRLLQLLVRVAGKVVGVILVLMSFGILISLAFSLLGVLTGTAIHSPDNIDSFSVQEFASLLFIDSADMYLVIIGVFIAAIVPFVGILYGGLSLLINMKQVPRGLGWSLFGLWVVGLSMVGYVALSVTDSFSKVGYSRDAESFHPAGDTLQVEIDNELRWKLSSGLDKDFDFYFSTRDSILALDEVYLKITESPDSLFYLEITNQARGANFQEAERKADAIEYAYSYDEDALALASFHVFSSKEKWRNQETHLLLKVPQGKTIFLHRDLKYLLDDIPNVSHTYDGDMVNHYWTMTSEGLYCPDFARDDEDEKDDKTDIDIESVDVDLDIRGDIDLDI